MTCVKENVSYKRQSPQTAEAANRFVILFSLWPTIVYLVKRSAQGVGHPLHRIDLVEVGYFFVFSLYENLTKAAVSPFPWQVRQPSVYYADWVLHLTRHSVAEDLRYCSIWSKELPKGMVY